jgi:phosphate-selective porin OprO and OprP
MTLLPALVADFPPNASSSTPRIARPLRRAWCAAVILACAPVSGAWAASDAEVAALRQQVRDLEARLVALEAATRASRPAPATTDVPDNAQLVQNVRVLQRRLEIKDEEAAAAASTTPIVTAGEKGFSLASKDGAFAFKLRGLIHADARDFQDDETLAANVDTFLLRRVRPTIEGTVFGIYDFRFAPDFAGSRTVLQDAYIDARFSPKAKLRVGKFKQPFGLERLQSASDIRFIERALPTNLAPNRDVGVQLHGDVLGNRVNYALGVFNGVIDGGSSDGASDADNNGDKDFAARVFVQPFLTSDNFALRGLGVGLAASYVDQAGNAAATQLPTYRTPGQNGFFSYRTGATPTIADGERLRWSPQLTWYYGSWGFSSEYIRVSQDVARTIAGVTRSDTLDHDSWQVAVNWVLTGEEASFVAVKPRAPYKIGEPGWGAWEFVARASELDVDDATFAGGAQSFADPNAAASDAQAWSVGVNWYLNRHLKWAFDYEQTRFDGGAASGADRPDEKVVFSRLQIAF